MKNHTIKTPTAELLIVELPEGYHYHVNKKAICIHGLDKSDWTVFNGSYTLLGKPDEIREEDAEDLVEIFDLSYYVNYNHPTRGAYTLTAKESLLSLLESEIYWDVNPLGDEPNHWDYKFEKYKGEFHFKSESHKSRYGNAYEKWQDAELRTFDRSRTLIFVKQ